MKLPRSDTLLSFWVEDIIAAKMIDSSLPLESKRFPCKLLSLVRFIKAKSLEAQARPLVSAVPRAL